MTFAGCDACDAADCLTSVSDHPDERYMVMLSTIHTPSPGLANIADNYDTSES